MSLRGAIDRFLLVLLEQIPQPVWLRGIRCDCYRWWTPSDHHHVVVLEYPPFCRGYRDRLWLRWGIIYHQRVAVGDSRGRHRRDWSRCRCSDRGWRRTCLRRDWGRAMRRRVSQELLEWLLPPTRPLTPWSPL